MLRGSRAVNGRADAGLFELLLIVFLDKSSREGRGLELGIVGEPGSFFTTIRGGALAPRDLLKTKVNFWLTFRMGKEKTTRRS